MHERPAPLALTGLSSRVDHIYVRETSDFRGHPSRQVVVDLFGFTRSAKDYAAAVRPFRAYQRSLFAESVQFVAENLDVTLDGIDESDEFELASEEFEIAAGLVRVDTVCASRWTFTGLVRGRPFMTVECVYKADATKVHRWSEPGFSIHIEGVPQMTLSVEEISHGLASAAAHAVNSVAAVCAAPPGIHTVLDLPSPPAGERPASPDGRTVRRSASGPSRRRPALLGDPCRKGLPVFNM
ncbi:hypothetical protein ACFQX6_51730 [Streptosporangium lutulentum]